MPNVMATLSNTGGALCSTPQFGCAVTMPSRENRWNLLGCPKLTKRSQPLVGRSSPYCKDMWGRYCCSTSLPSYPKGRMGVSGGGGDAERKRWIILVNICQTFSTIGLFGSFGNLSSTLPDLVALGNYGMEKGELHGGKELAPAIDL